MITTKKTLFAIGLVAFLFLPLLVLSCSTTPAQEDAQLTGATLWQQQCIRCLEYRTPAAYSDSQWETVMLHMRTRANLSAEDSQAILEFMKSAN